jgi:hypothetical protein
MELNVNNCYACSQEITNVLRRAYLSIRMKQTGSDYSHFEKISSSFNDVISTVEIIKRRKNRQGTSQDSQCPIGTTLID